MKHYNPNNKNSKNSFTFERARILHSYHQIRLERTEWFQNRNPLDPAIDELLKIGVFLPLPDKDEQHRQIIIIRTGAHNPRKHKQNDVFKVGMMIMDYLMSTDNELSVYGNRAIFGNIGNRSIESLRIV